jgi:hypothetical protein
MSNDLKRQWTGTDDEARQETYGGGSSYWLASPWPRAGLVVAAVVAVASVVSVPFLWPTNPGGTVLLAALGLAFSGYVAAASRWTLRHPEQAGHHLAAASHYNNAKWRNHPVSLAAGLTVFGFVNGFIRIDDDGIAGRLIGGVASATLVAVIASIAIWHARRTAPHNDN